MSETVQRIKIPYYERQLENVAAAIRDGELAVGHHLDLLSERLALMFGKAHVALTSSGFAALFVALKAGLDRPHPVLTAPASTCHAVTNAVRAAGHELRFADVELTTASLPSPGDGVAIVPDHFGSLAHATRVRPQAGRFLIEDASQAFMSRAQSRDAADVIVLSFYPTKFANGIDGGALLTDDAQLAERARRCIYYSDQHRYESECRYNFRMNNVNAAFMLGTLEHLAEMSTRLTTLYGELSAAMRRKGTRHLEMRNGEVASRFLVIAADAADKQAWLEHLQRVGIEGASELLFVCPEVETARFPVASRLVSTSFSLPFHPLLSDAELERVLMAIGTR
jgi:dTDP-4-amino-4,6-dideoxygalactose transaminase